MFYFKRLHIDAFFFFRLSHFTLSVEVLYNTIVLATQKEFLEYNEKLKEDPLGDYDGKTVTESARLKRHVLFFFFYAILSLRKFFLVDCYHFICLRFLWLVLPRVTVVFFLTLVFLNG